MSGLREALTGYLDLRRSLGFKLERDEKLLDQFVSYLEERRTGTVTIADALAWATLPAGGSPGWLRMRMTVVRGFAAYLATADPATEVPPASLLPGGARRAVPYLYSAADIAALLAQAGQLKTPLRRATITTLIGLMAVTGMRGGEAVAADDEDFDPARGCCWCAPPNSASTGCSRCTRPRSRPCKVTGRSATSSSAARAATRCWYPAREPGCCITTSARPSPSWPAAPGWPPARGPAGPGRMICGIRRTAGLCALPWRFRC